MSEQKWIKQANLQEDAAIAHLIEITSHSAYFIAKCYVKKDSDVEDVLQESYIKAFQHLDQVKDETHLIKWFHCIVANTSKDFLKKRNVALFSDIADEEHPIEIEDSNLAFSPDQAQDYKETQRMVMEIIAQLPDDQRMCLIMYYYDQLSSREIAEALSVSEAIVKSRLRYAKGKLVREVEEYEQKHDVKLHSSVILPFIAYVLHEEAKQFQMPQSFHISMPKGKQKGIVRLLHSSSLRWGVVSFFMLIGVVLGYLLWHYETNLMTLKQPLVELEYGEAISLRAEDYVVCKKAYACANAKVEFDFAQDQEHILAGVYEGRVIHRYEVEVFQLKIVDTSAPQITWKQEEVAIVAGDAFDSAANIESVKDIIDGELPRSDDTSLYEYGYLIMSDVDSETAGTYTVTVSAYDRNGNQNKQSHTVRVSEKPKQIVATTPQSPQPGQSVNQIPEQSSSPTGIAVANAAKGYVGNTSYWFEQWSCIGTAHTSLTAAGVDTSALHATYDSRGKDATYQVASPQVGDIIMYYSSLGIYHCAIYIGNGLAVHGGFNPKIVDGTPMERVTVEISAYNAGAASEVKFFRFW